VAYGQERVIIASRGMPKAAVISVEDLELVEELEDAMRAREALAEDPRPAGCRPVELGRAGMVRLRVGDYRVIYLVLDDEQVVVVARVEVMPSTPPSPSASTAPSWPSIASSASASSP
jgi:mRNA-degrading endonuclease RelE of RelBE toxin-antitoxin system